MSPSMSPSTGPPDPARSFACNQPKHCARTTGTGQARQDSSPHRPWPDLDGYTAPAQGDIHPPGTFNCTWDMWAGIWKTRSSQCVVLGSAVSVQIAESDFLLARQSYVRRLECHHIRHI